MSKAKFNRESAKSKLENVVVETVQQFFHLEGERAREKNIMKNKFSEDVPKIEGALKTFDSIRTKLRILNMFISLNKPKI